jgi:hypothetical protein
LDIGIAQAKQVISGRVGGTDWVLRDKRQVGAQAHRPLRGKVDPKVPTQFHGVGGERTRRPRRESASWRGRVLVKKLEKGQRTDEVVAGVFEGRLSPNETAVGRNSGGHQPVRCDWWRTALSA